MSNITGTSGGETLLGNADDDNIDGLGGNDTIKGFGGKDTLYGGDGDDHVYGGSGNDTIYLGTGADYIDGGNGNDTLIIDLTGSVAVFDATIDLTVGTVSTPQYPSLDDTLFSIENVTILGSYSVVLIGDSARNILKTDSGDDKIYGRGGNDEIHGGSGVNQLYGGGGRDTFYEGSGDSLVKGGAGNDTIFNGGGSDVFDGGTGVDTLVTDVSGFAFNTVLLDLGAGTHGRLNSTIGQDTVAGIENFTVFGDWDVQAIGDAANNVFKSDTGSDTVTGNGGNDTLISGAGKDKLLGGAGSDTLKGGGGADKLFGNGGKDTLVGGGGRDVLTGGSGADVFYFGNASESSTNQADVIRDFNRGVDLLDLHNVAPGLVFIGSAAFTGTQLEVRVGFTADGKALVRVDDNGDGIADMKIILNGITAMDASDFIL